MINIVDWLREYAGNRSGMDPGASVYLYKAADEIERLYVALEYVDNPRFVGLWTYKPYGAERKFCASVMVNGLVAETGMYDTWLDALAGAKEILNETQSS